MEREQPARLMTDDQIKAELEKLRIDFCNFREGLDGMSGSPGEWMTERMGELETERVRRLVSLDGDIGRRHSRI